MLNSAWHNYPRDSPLPPSLLDSCDPKNPDIHGRWYALSLVYFTHLFAVHIHAHMHIVYSIYISWFYMIAICDIEIWVNAVYQLLLFIHKWCLVSFSNWGDHTLKHGSIRHGINFINSVEKKLVTEKRIRVIGIKFRVGRMKFRAAAIRHRITPPPFTENYNTRGKLLSSLLFFFPGTLVSRALLS